MESSRHEYWECDDQAERLAELTATTSPQKEAPLRRDVRSLGRLLGNVIREQAGDDLFDAVESLRLMAIEHRESTGADADLMQRAEGIVQRLDIDQAHGLTRAFAIYFELTNLAETAHRRRRRRAWQINADAASHAGSFAATFRHLRAAGVTAESVRELLNATLVIPVFTAHPTEVARRTVLFKRRRIADALEELDHLPLTDEDAALQRRRIAADITTLWQTDEVRRRRPSVVDEVRMGLDYYADVLIDTIPAVYDEIAAAFAELGDDTVSAHSVPTVVRFGSWIGGDRDGNPYVTPAVTRAALQLARQTIIDFYLHSLESLVERLSASTHQADVSQALQQRLDEYAESIATLDPRPGSRSDAEVYRRFLGYVGWRLKSARRPRPWRTARMPAQVSLSTTWYACVRAWPRSAASCWRSSSSTRCCGRCPPSACTCTRWTSASTRVCTRPPPVRSSRRRLILPCRSRRPTTP
jgi:phosphoenolpyruvate carboxylase